MPLQNRSGEVNKLTLNPIGERTPRTNIFLCLWLMKSTTFSSACNHSSFDHLDDRIDSICSSWYAEYAATFEFCSIFGWDFEKESKELLVAFASTQKRHGVTINQLCEWVSAIDRDTLLGTIPAPDFSALAQASEDAAADCVQLSLEMPDQ